MLMGFQSLEFSLGLEMFVLGKIVAGPKECQGRKEYTELHFPER